MDADAIAALEDAMEVPFDRTNGKRPTAREVLASLQQRGYVLMRTHGARSVPARGDADASARGLMSSLDDEIERARARRDEQRTRNEDEAAAATG